MRAQLPKNYRDSLLFTAATQVPTPVRFLLSGQESRLHASDIHILRLCKSSITTIFEVIEVFSVRAIRVRTIELDFKLPERQTSLETLEQKTLCERVKFLRSKFSVAAPSLHGFRNFVEMKAQSLIPWRFSRDDL